jgi:hypothetical protein
MRALPQERNEQLIISCFNKVCIIRGKNIRKLLQLDTPKPDPLESGREKNK